MRGDGRMSMRVRAGALLVLLTIASAAWATVTIRDPGTYVVDGANVFDPATRQKLEGWFGELERVTKAQVKVLTTDLASENEVSHAAFFRLDDHEPPDAIASLRNRRRHHLY